MHGSARRREAGQYAELTGSELGEVVGIEDRTVSSSRRAEVATDDAAAFDQEMAVPLEPGQQDVTVQVTVRWSLDG